jgi:hypothetical protein
MNFKFKDEMMYNNQQFTVESYHPADPSMNLLKLKCTTDETIVIERYVKLDEIELVQ